MEQSGAQGTRQVEGPGGMPHADETRAQRHLEALLGSSEPLQPLTDPASVARLGAEQGAALIPGIQCTVVLREPGDDGVLRLAGAAGPLFTGMVGTIMPLAGSLAEKAMSRGAAVETSRARRESPVAAQIDGAPETARLVPLRVTEADGRIATLGVIGYYREAPEGFIVEERRLLDDYALRVAVALHRALLLEAATTTARRLRIGIDLAIDLGSSLDPDQVVERLLERTLDALDADSVVLLRILREAAVVEGCLDRSGQAWHQGVRLPLNAPPLRSALERRQPSTEAYDPAALYPALRPHLEGVRHTVTTPIVLHGGVFAALVLSRRRDQPFGADDVAVLTELSPVAGLTLYNARLFGEVDAARVRTAQLAERLSVGFEAAMELGAELEPRRLVRRLIERVAAAVGADRASFGRVADDVMVIEDSVATALGEALPPGITWNVEAVELLRAAVHERRPAQTSRATAPASMASLIGGMEHVVVVPLLQQGRTVAVISVGRRRDQPFDEDALAILQQVGTIAVLALRNARLFEARRDFMNMAAHELRTPLTVLNGYLSMLRDGTFGPPSERWHHPVEVMAGKVDELARLVDDLLIGARLERGAVHPEPQLVDLAGLVRRAVERAQPRAEMLGGSISFEAPACPLEVQADADNIGKIMDNLLNNALTYTIGAPRVEVRVERDGDVARAAVTDHGRGIPEPLHERVFEQFFRIEDRRLGYPLGTGLGLYISRQLTEAHGGRLRIVRSVPGEGSVFALELPAPGEPVSR